MTNFTDIIKNRFLEEFTAITITDALVAIALAFALSVFIVYVYRMTYGGVSYSKSFAKCLIMLSMVTAVVILVIMGLVREVLGSGSVAGFDIAFLADYTIPVMTKAPGGFVVYSILAAVISKLHKNPKLEGNSAACAAAGLDVCCCKNEEVEQ